MRRAIGDRPIEIVNAVAGQLVGHALLPSLGLGQSHTGHLRIGEGRPGDDGIVGLEPFESSEQGVDDGIPSLVCGRVGELERSGHVTHRIDVGVLGLKVGIGLDGASGRQRDPQFLQTIAGHARAAPYRAQQLVKGDGLLFLLAAAHDQVPLPLTDLNPYSLVAGENVHAIGAQRGGHLFAGLGVFARQQAWRHLDLGHAAAQTGKALRELAADGPAAQDQ